MFEGELCCIAATDSIKVLKTANKFLFYGGFIYTVHYNSPNLLKLISNLAVEFQIKMPLSAIIDDP
jgi:hypothetical protein